MLEKSLFTEIFGGETAWWKWLGTGSRGRWKDSKGHVGRHLLAEHHGGSALGLALGPTAASRAEGEPSGPSAEHIGPLGMGLARLGGLFPSNIWSCLKDRSLENWAHTLFKQCPNQPRCGELAELPAAKAGLGAPPPEPVILPKAMRRKSHFAGSLN